MELSSPPPPPLQQPTHENDDGCHSKGPKPTMEELLQCQFSAWYPLFRDLHNVRIGSRKRKNVTIPSKILAPLQPEFRDFLLSDGVHLPKGATELSSAMPSTFSQDEWSDQNNDHNALAESAASNQQNRQEKDEADTTDDGETDQNSLPDARLFHFPQLNEQIKEAIEELGGAVMPKLNWSAPKDATWMNQGSLKCETPGDVYLLLKSSDFVLHDVLHALDDVIMIQRTTDNSDNTTNAAVATNGGGDYYPSLELVLRKWCNLHDSMEFRCFVYKRQLVAVSQRNHTMHFPHLLDRQEEILHFIQEFLRDVVLSRFPLSNYVVDVYLDQQNRTWILDFNVWGRQTDALLFDWDDDDWMRQVAERTTHEARTDHKQNHNDDDDDDDDDEDKVEGTMQQLHVDFRLVETGMEVRHDPLASYRAPIDTIHLSSITGGDAAKFQEFMALCQQPSSQT